MAEFAAPVVELTIEEHPNADALELARVGDYLSIVPKGKYKTGDLGVYIPEQAVLPERVIARLGLEGRLAGKQKNRVKAIKLRGILSQGLIFPVETNYDVIETGILGEPSKVKPGPSHCIRIEELGAGHVVELGYDCAPWMGITKYEPKIPTHMNGQVFNASGYTLKFDIENIKKYPDIIEEGEMVAITEKLHGTWACFGYHPDIEHPIVTSKGLSAQGLAFKMTEENDNNLYVRTFRYKVERELDMLKSAHPGKPVYILGEIYGQGVQDLHYDAAEPEFRIFDIYIGTPGQGIYMDAPSVSMGWWQTDEVGVPTVPSLYVGPYSKDLLDEHTSGQTTLGECIREGVVIRPLLERRHDDIGRVILKSVSEQYLLRKGGTEFN